MDAANIDLKGFTERFYWRTTGGHLADVLDTIAWAVHDTTTWVELTTLLIPGLNDDPADLRAQCAWIAGELGPDVPLHLSAFHPAHAMRDVPPTPHSTLRAAREIAHDAGLHFVYTGNVHDPSGETTTCPTCHHTLIERDWYALLRYDLDPDGRCPACHTPLPGRFAEAPGTWGRRTAEVTFD
jgi:pyruvate formate lyase activating enzyme